jgi:superfamily I DNA/RNA helicase
MVIEQIEKIIGGISHFSLDSGRVGSDEDGDSLGFGDIAVLYRLNSQGHALEEAFRRSGIPYVMSGEKPLNEQYPVNTIWRVFQILEYPDKQYYRDLYSTQNKATMSQEYDYFLND